MATPKNRKKATISKRWQVQILIEKKSPIIQKTWISKITKNILTNWLANEIPSETDELSIVFTSDKNIQVLNRDYRKKDKATDVLSFPQIVKGKGSFPSKSLGDLVISVDTAKIQAKKYGVTFKEEIARLLVHGILHLAGYDHEGVTKKEAQRMRRKEAGIMRALFNN